MKAFIAACTALLICIVVSFSAQFFVTNSAKDIEDFLSQLSEELQETKTPENIECLDSALKLLASRRFIMYLCINSKDIDELECTLANLRASVISGDAGNYASYLVIAREKLRKIRMHESLSPAGVL